MRIHGGDGLKKWNVCQIVGLFLTMSSREIVCAEAILRLITCFVDQDLSYDDSIISEAQS